jgi:hypothetical protein
MLLKVAVLSKLLRENFAFEPLDPFVNQHNMPFECTAVTKFFQASFSFKKLESFVD